MSMFQPGDRVKMVDCSYLHEAQAAVMMGRCGTVSNVRFEPWPDGEEKYLDVVFDDEPDRVDCGWLPWRFRLLEDDFPPSELGIEVLL